MKKYANITCGVLTPSDTSTIAHGKLILELLARHPWAAPTHLGNEEPIRELYTEVADGIRHWADPVLWKNKSSKAEGSVWFGKGKKHSCLYLNAEPKQSIINQDLWISFLVDACDSLQADFGYIHLTTEQEMADPNILYDHTYAVDRGLTTHDLRKGIPNLSWAMIFGKVYQPLIQRFGRASTLMKFKEMPTLNQFFVQLTSSIEEIRKDYQTFDAARRRLKEELGDDFLCSINGSAQWKPTFATDSNP